MEATPGIRPPYVDRLVIYRNNADPLELTVSAIEQLPTFEVRCVAKIASYRGFLGIYDYIGVPLTEVIRLAGFDRDLHTRQQLLFVIYGADGFYASFSWGELFNMHGTQVMLAIKSRLVRDDDNQLIEEEQFQPLRASWGGAFRLIVPGDNKYPDMRSIKWVNRIYCGDSDMVTEQFGHTKQRSYPPEAEMVEREVLETD